MNGFAAGVQGGYNWQFRCTLFGIEADYNWTDIDHDFVRTGTGPLGATLTVSSSLQSFGTLRARSGVIVDNLLLYVTGGLAYANTERSVALAFPTAPQFNHGPFSDEKTRWGWTMGFGTEWSFATNWSLKSEVFYARFETEETAFICRLICEPNRPVRFEHESEAWVTRIGINYRFDWDPVSGYPGAGEDIDRQRCRIEDPLLGFSTLWLGPGERTNAGAFFIRHHSARSRIHAKHGRLRAGRSFKGIAELITRRVAELC